MNIESIRMALRGVLANRMRSALTMLGVLIGVGAVIVLIAVGAGSAVASEARLKALGSNTLTVSAGGLGQGNRGGTQARNIQLTDADLTALADKTQAPDITAVVPLINAPSQTATYAGASTPVGQTIGTAPAYSTVRNAGVQAGTFFTQSDVDNHSNVVVTVNGVTTCELKDYKGRTDGQFALQMHAGVVNEVMFKDIEIAE